MDSYIEDYEENYDLYGDYADDQDYDYGCFDDYNFIDYLDDEESDLV